MENITYFIIFLLLVVILLGFRKSFSLLFTKWIYGEYSKKYVLKFKKRTRKKPHPYCFKDDFYYHILSIPKAVKCDVHYKSEKEFDFDHLDFSKKFKENLKENGKPDCFTISEDKGVNLGVIGYKSRMFHSNEKTLLYHCNDQYFMGEYVFSSLSDETSAMIINLLQQQFNAEIQHAKNFAITDAKGNYLYFTDTGFYLSLKFFNINNMFISKTLKKFGENQENNIPLEGLGITICQ